MQAFTSLSSSTMTFQEKSLWVQFVSLIFGVMLYASLAAPLLQSGTDTLVPFLPLLAVAVAGIVAVNIAGHIVVTVFGDERSLPKRSAPYAPAYFWTILIGLATSVGIWTFSGSVVWIVHALLLTLALAECARFVQYLRQFASAS
ncbi:MAG: hypothetical protein RhofKO_34920 [Rhodothermales bacterium]